MNERKNQRNIESEEDREKGEQKQKERSTEGG